MTKKDKNSCKNKWAGDISTDSRKKTVNIFREIKEGIMSLEQEQAALKKNS